MSKQTKLNLKKREREWNGESKRREEDKKREKEGERKGTKEIEEDVFAFSEWETGDTGKGRKWK